VEGGIYRFMGHSSGLDFRIASQKNLRKRKPSAKLESKKIQNFKTVLCKSLLCNILIIKKWKKDDPKKIVITRSLLDRF